MGERGQCLAARPGSEPSGDKPTLPLDTLDVGSSWDKPCPSCTSLMDGFHRTWYSAAEDVTFAAIAKAPVEATSAWVKERGWSQIPLLSGFESPFQADYRCQGETDDMQLPVMHEVHEAGRANRPFLGNRDHDERRRDGVAGYWNLLDFTLEGRPDRETPPQRFRPELVDNNYLDVKSI